MTLVQQLLLLTEDPDRIFFYDIPGFEQSAAIHDNEVSRDFSSEGALVFGMLGGKFVCADRGDRSPADAFIMDAKNIGDIMIHIKLWMQNWFSEEDIEAAHQVWQEISSLFAEEIFDYASLQAYEEYDGTGMDDFKERVREQYSLTAGEPPDDDDDAFFVWDEGYGAAIDEAMDALWDRIEPIRAMLWKNDEDIDDDPRCEYFELPGRAWRVLNDHGDDVIFISFWGSSEHPQRPEIIAKIRDMIGGGPDAETWYEDAWNDEWFNDTPARPNADGSSAAPVAAAAPVTMMPVEIAARINRLNAQMHTATPEEKEKIRAAVAALRKEAGEVVDPKAGAGSKTQGKRAAAAGFDHAAGYHAARRHETVIRELEDAVR